MLLPTRSMKALRRRLERRCEDLRRDQQGFKDLGKQVRMRTRPASPERGPSFAYSLPVRYFHTRRDRVAALKTCRLHGAAIQNASPPGPGRALTLPCGWNNAGQRSLSPELAAGQLALNTNFLQSNCDMRPVQPNRAFPARPGLRGAHS